MYLVTTYRLFRNRIAFKREGKAVLEASLFTSLEHLLHLLHDVHGADVAHDAVPLTRGHVHERCLLRQVDHADAPAPARPALEISPRFTRL